jgi:hypothetical protein
MRLAFALLFLCTITILSGCAGDGGPPRYRLSGEVTYDGKPIPYGDILFTPDADKDNSGPQGIAQIRNGRYDTSGSEGKGIAGGPTVIRVTGFTEAGGKLLCEVEVTADLPKDGGTHNINIPKTKQGPSNTQKPPDI